MSISEKRAQLYLIVAHKRAQTGTYRNQAFHLRLKCLKFHCFRTKDR